MGVCSCKKRTNLFCFSHKKAVCEDCICTEHNTCPIKKYLDWLNNSNFETPSCSVCKEVFQVGLDESDENSAIRLKCLDLYHKKCLTQHINNLKNTNISKENHNCLTCTGPIYTNEKTSKLEQNLQSFQSLLEGNSINKEINQSSSTFDDSNPRTKTKPPNLQHTVPTATVTSRSTSISSTLKTGDEIRLQINPVEDEEDDKYKKKNTFDTLTNFESNKITKSIFSNCSNQKLMAVIIFFVTFLTFVFLFFSSSSEIN
eukprot:TRINITY_DN2444_c0_g1_i1.p1 TRINITY_DN2444_c0_g1~~TRINITY_DN2444_c0_g1_i1.p1  ORF type:complete len:258 (-),score=34.65 TRINITY_DN2444_c0_g1_i1:84-857(-)